MKYILSSMLIAICSIAFAQQHVVINEVFLGKENGWVELYNPTDKSQFLEHLYLSNTPEDVRKWPIRDSNITIAPHSFYVFYIGVNKYRPHIDTIYIDGLSLFLYEETGSYIEKIDEFSLDYINKGIYSQSRYPDGEDNFYASNKLTQGEKNKIKKPAIEAHVTVKQSMGISSAVYRQVRHETKTSPRVFLSSKIGGDITILDRYKMPLYIGISRFKHGFSNSFSDTTSTNYVRKFSSKGKEVTSWVDLTLPFLYHEVRVYDKFYLDFGFVVAFQYEDKTSYTQKREVFDPNGNPVPQFNSNETFSGSNSFSVRLPFQVGIQYEVIKNGYLSLNYMLRKTEDDPTYDTRKDTRYTFNVGFAYSPAFFRL